MGVLQNVALTIALTASSSILAQVQGQSPTVAGNPGQAFGADFYPVEAMRNRQEGRVVAVVEIGEDGLPTGCSVAESSGAPSLDAITCRQAMTLMFNPALGASGKPVPGIYRLPVRWTLPAELPGTLTKQVRIVSDRSHRFICRLEWEGTQRLMASAACSHLADVYTKAGVDLRKPVFAPVAQEDLVSQP